MDLDIAKGYIRSGNHLVRAGYPQAPIGFRSNHSPCGFTQSLRRTTACESTATQSSNVDPK